jgi:hypothetical protein
MIRPSPVRFSSVRFSPVPSRFDGSPLPRLSPGIFRRPDKTPMKEKSNPIRRLRQMEGCLPSLNAIMRLFHFYYNAIRIFW